MLWQQVLFSVFVTPVQIPWASSLRKFNNFGPNMLLYWSLICYACDNKFGYFDFGRSTPEEGTFKFKEQWGAKPFPGVLAQYYVEWAAHARNNESEKSRYGTAIRYWKKLPLPISNAPRSIN